MTRFPLLLLAFSMIRFGCHAQTPAPNAPLEVGKPIPAEVAYRVESLIRRKASDLPPMSDVNLSPLAPSNMPGFYQFNVTLSNNGNLSHPIAFLISNDGKKLEQVTSYDISAESRTYIPYAGRPGRGGSEAAPVIIVGFDDLECPYCAKLHASIFPAITDRYGDKVHIVYRDYPLEMHPWAMRAAVDVNCLADQSAAAYWNAVDEIHAHASTIGNDPKDPKAERTMERASAQLDKIAHEEGDRQHIDDAKLSACIQKQETAKIDEEVRLAQSLNLVSTPTLFINGSRIDGAIPVEFIFSQIDKALRAEGVTPPPPYVAPKPPAAPATPAATPAAPKS